MRLNSSREMSGAFQESRFARVLTHATVLIGIWICLFGLASCQRSPEVARPGTMYIVLVDKSGSVASDSPMYRAGLLTIVSQVQDGDRFLIAPITGASGSDFRQLKEHALPEMIAPAGWMDEPIQVQKAQDAQQKKVQTVRDAMTADVDALLSQPSDAKRSAIFESLRTVAPLFEGEPRRRKLLIVLSDMVEDSEIANFERSVVSQGFIEKELKRQSSAGILPRLQGVSICVGGALASPPEKAAALERFWSEYFKASGAVLRSGHYARVLTTCSD